MQNEQRSVRKALYLAMAVFVALVIWLYVDEFGNNGGPRLTQKEFNDIPIEYIHEEALMDHGLMLVEDGSDQTVDIELEATRRLIADIDREKIHIIADLSDITEAGTQTIQPRLTYSGYRLFGGQRITITQSMLKEMNPFTATVNIKELNSKPVEVRCLLRGNVADGYSAGQLQMSDTMIEIWGQEEDLAPVSYAKVVLDIGEAAVSSVEQSLPITYYDEHDQPLDGTGIRSTVQEIKVKMPVSVTRELRLAVDLKESPGARAKNVQVDIQPKTIMVSGDASELNGVESIVLSEFDLMNLKAQTTATSYTYPITVPEGCTNLSGVTRATMTISFMDMTAAEVTTNQFVYEHLPKGKTVDILTEEMTISIFGTTADVAAVKPDHITVLADLTDYSAASGSYTVPARIVVDGAGDIGIRGTYDVRVVIQDDPEAESIPEETEEPKPTGEEE